MQLKEDASRTEAPWSSSTTGCGADTFQRTQRSPEFCGGPKEHCLRSPPTACGNRTAGACVALFARATRSRRLPQLFGEGETRKAHAISNVQELGTRGKPAKIQ